MATRTPPSASSPMWSRAGARRSWTPWMTPWGWSTSPAVESARGAGAVTRRWTPGIRTFLLVAISAWPRSAQRCTTSRMRIRRSSGPWRSSTGSCPRRSVLLRVFEDGPNLDELEPQRLDPLEDPVQGRLVLDPATQDGLGGLDVCRERIERGVQRGTQPASDANFVSGGGHGRPSSSDRKSVSRRAAFYIAHQG